MRKSLKKGFTLIELLVVIAIIGILATIVIINVAKARGKAVDAQVLSNMSAGDKTMSACIVGDEFADTTTAHMTSALGICWTTVAGTTASAIWQDKWTAMPSGVGSTGTAWTYGGAANGKTITNAVTATPVIGAASSGSQIGCDVNGCTKNY